MQKTLTFIAPCMHLHHLPGCICAADCHIVSTDCSNNDDGDDDDDDDD